MTRRRIALAALALFVLSAAAAPAADPPPLQTARGQVEKVDKETLTVKPRGPDGKFGANIVLKLTGTSKVTLLAPRKGAGGKTVVAQKEITAQELEAKQAIAVIYTTADDSPVLLSAVAQPPAAK